MTKISAFKIPFPIRQTIKQASIIARRSDPTKDNLKNNGGISGIFYCLGIDSIGEIGNVDGKN